MKYVLGLILAFSVTFGYAQTKKEKKVKVTSLNSGMYEGTKSDKAQKIYDLAAKKHAAEDYKGAIKLYKETLKEDPNFVEVYDNMGVCYRRLGDFKNAIKSYKKSIEIYPEGGMAHQNLGMIYGIQKEYEKAISEYKIVQKLDPDDAEGYYGAINNYLNLGKYKEAIESAIKTVEIYEATESPYLYQAHYLLGLSYYYDNDKKNAKTYIALAKKKGMKISQQLLDDLGIK
jgi:tetratricopeptide (TPR) repeat protein